MAISRKRINHRGPVSIAVDRCWYFVTLCAHGHTLWMPIPDDGAVGSRVPRDRAACSDADAVGSRVPRDRVVDFDFIANAMLDAARWYHNNGIWQLAMFLVMPDHLHFIARFPYCGHAGRVTLPELGSVRCDGHAGRVTLPMTAAVRRFKGYLRRTVGIRFQRDFWDTRLRDDSHFAEKFQYVCLNPVRKGLCAEATEWPYVIAFHRQTGEECDLRDVFSR